MIVFLNFAPISFMGGAEKLMLELATATNNKEKVVLIDVSPKIANIYGKFVLKRSFSNHSKDHRIKNLLNYESLTFKNFVPFTAEYNNIHQVFKEASKIYMRFELLEVLIAYYFGGINILKKSVAGMHLTPYYTSPRGLMDKLHNIIYGSFFYKYLLNSTLLIHVLNKRDKKLLEEKYDSKKSYFLPAGVDFKNLKSKKHNTRNDLLHIIFVGELSIRKGVDTLISIIKKSPDNFVFSIIGDGPLKDEIASIKSKKIHFYGYIKTQDLYDTYSNSDVLLFPSRSEAFGIVMAEAMAFGLKVVNSKEVSLGLPAYIETSIDKRVDKNYLQALNTIFHDKRANKIDRKKISQFAKDQYSESKVNQKFLNNILQI